MMMTFTLPPSMPKAEQFRIHDGHHGDFVNIYKAAVKRASGANQAVFFLDVESDLARQFAKAMGYADETLEEIPHFITSHPQESIPWLMLPVFPKSRELDHLPAGEFGVYLITPAGVAMSKISLW